MASGPYRIFSQAHPIVWLDQFAAPFDPPPFYCWRQDLSSSFYATGTIRKSKM
jgi:hypothetical protein